MIMNLWNIIIPTLLVKHMLCFYFSGKVSFLYIKLFGRYERGVIFILYPRS